MVRGRVLAILKAYGVGPNLLRVLTYFWDHAVLVCRAERGFRGAILGKKGCGPRRTGVPDDL